MGLALQKRTLKKIFLFTALLLGFAFQGGYGQTTLSPGDIAIIGFNGDANDDFATVTFTDISGGDEIHFSSEEWDGSGFEGPGGHLTWIAPTGGISAGTVLIFNEVGGNPTVNFGSIIDDSNINLSGSGDVIYAYTGTSQNDPDAFLGATATSSNIYDGTTPSDGTLANTGLTQDTDAILLPDNIDVAEYAGNRSGNTQNVYQTELNDNNWETANGSGDQSGEILPFDDTNFVLVDPPTVAFTASSLFVDEDGTSIDLTVELVEDNTTAVDVDVVFVDGASTASSSDINGFSSETVNFLDSDASETTKNEIITLNDDTEFEGDEKAVFQLQNNTEGTIIEPSELTLSITDDDAPDIVFNEINADPGDDANGDEDVDSESDEFIEWVNNSDKNIDISGWKFFDSTSDTERFTFPEGTIIPAEHAVILFDSGIEEDPIQPKGNFGGASIFADSELNLNNSPETLILKDENGNIVTTATYDNDASGESNVLSPEIIGNNYVDHSSLSSSDLLSSPGTDVDGTPFGSKHAIGIRGTEGWRMISSPVQSATFEDFFGDFWMQGLAGSNDEGGDGTIFSWDESGGTFTAPANMSDNLDPGKGYIVYFFEDDDNNAPGIQGGFPKIINSDGTENSDVSNIPVTASDEDDDGIDDDEGWNLLGNPFDTDIIASEVIAALEEVNENVNTNIHVWDHEADNGNGDWITLSGDETIAPFQGFFVRYETDGVDGNVSFSKNDLEANTGAEFFKNGMEDLLTFDLQLHGEQYYDTYSLEFSENGTTELDRYDAYKLFSLNPNSINLFSTQSNNRLQKNALPIDLESRLEIPLSFDANGRSSLTFQWDEGMENIPNEWDLILIDNEQNREIDLRRDNEYSFTVTADQQEESQITSDKKGLLNKSKVTQDSRFTLSVQPNIQDGISTDLPESVKLKPNYPNPFNPTTTIPYELTEDSDVLLTVWNMIGQKVATLVDGMVEAGTHEVNWNASDMPSGMYIARFEVNGTVFTRKMTLIK